MFKILNGIVFNPIRIEYENNYLRIFKNEKDWLQSKIEINSDKLFVIDNNDVVFISKIKNLKQPDEITFDDNKTYKISDIKALGFNPIDN